MNRDVTFSGRSTLAVYVVSIAVAAGLTLNACAKKEDSHFHPPVSGQNDLLAPAWKIKLTSDCAAESAPSREQCRAGYGFAVSADGRYQVGPGPGGQILTGQLRSAELEILTEKVDHLLGTVSAASFFEGSETCVDQGNAEAPADVHHLDFNLRGRQKQLAKVDKTHFCATAQKEDVETIYTELKEYARVYYPIPFPDDCTNAALAVQELYAPLQACANDADCAYVNNTYESIPNGDLQFVVTDDCSVIPPLVAANHSRLSGEQPRLLAARERARDACGDRVFRINCEATSGFQADEAKAVCRQGSCRMNPAVVIR